MDRTVNYHFYTPEDGHGLARNPLKAIVAPRPIAWISTLSAGGVGNLAPYSFFNLINDAPPMLMFSSTGYKDTVRNIAETGEFTVSMATRTLAEAMNSTSAALPPEVDEFDAAALARLPSRTVAPPGVAGSPAVLECRSVSVRQLQDLAGAAVDSWMVIGQIVGVSVERGCLADGRFRTDVANPVLRAGYADEYWEITEAGRFAMRR